jgi:exoribonuclease-2
MLLAGEGAAQWALEHQLAFPFISQETENIPNKIPDGLAGAFALRRCMRPRTLSIKPGLHQGLGLDIYSQVTSPLRRYTDLLAHEQISAFLRKEPVLDGETLLMRLVAAERAALAVQHAERSSRAYWTAVYLSDKTGAEWDAIILEIRGPHAIMFITELGIEIQTALPRNSPPALNEPCRVKLTSVKIPEVETRWVVCA